MSTRHRRFTHIVVIIVLVVLVFPLGVSSLTGRLGQLFYRDPVPGNAIETHTTNRSTGRNSNAGHPTDAFEAERRQAAEAGEELGKNVPFTPAYASFLISDSSKADKLKAYAYQFLGTPYRFGAKGPRYFDCAGFTQYCFDKFGYSLGSGCSSQINQGTRVKSTKKLRVGDLVFYGDRYIHGLVGHVGMVVDVNPDKGTFHFIHASTSSGVIVTSSQDAYYQARYIGATRVLKDKDLLPSPDKG